MPTLIASKYNTLAHEGEHTFIHNGVTGAVMKMLRDEAALVLEGVDTDSTPLDFDIVARLIVAGIIVRNHDDELSVLSTRYHKGQANDGQLGLTLVTSLGCNFACPYCFENKHSSKMSPSTQESILALIHDQACKGIKRLSVTWFGGEPLLAPKVIEHLSTGILRLKAQFGFEYHASIITNGYLLSAKNVAILRSAEVSDIQVGLDGPQAVHDRMRPLKGGGGSFHDILANVKALSRDFNVSIRVNLDRANADDVTELFAALSDAQLQDRVDVYPGHLLTTNVNPLSPAASYSNGCMSRAEFSTTEVTFFDIARKHGFAGQSVPSPVATPCTAVRANELVVGSEGELYKCWDSVGNPLEAIGYISEALSDVQSRARTWLSYDPFADAECRACKALPSCMGGCAHQAPSGDNRCDTFRFSAESRIRTSLGLSTVASSPFPGRKMLSLMPISPK